MKKIFYITTLLTLASTMFISSCKKGLDVPVQGQITEELALIDPNAADKLVVGVYNNLYLTGTLGLKLVVIADVTSDDSDKGSVSTDPGFDGIFLDNFTYTPSTGIFNDFWVDNYKGISSANKALAVLEASTIDQGIKNRLIGEARFIRGLLYFNMVRTFGGVIKLTRIPTLAEAYNDEFQTRASKEEIYKVITDDLEFGAANLPIKGQPGAVVGRATKGAAQALLAKVYMYQGNWQGAYDMSSEVMKQNYDLAPVYADIFREKGVNNIESIFEIQTGSYANQTSGGLACDAVSKNYSNFQGPRGTFGTQTIGGQTYSGGDLGFGLNTPSANLAETYEADDVRKNGTIIFTSDVASTTLWDGFVLPARPATVNERYNYKAYHSPFLETKSCLGINDKDNKPKNIRVIRFAEVLLINAEAAAHIGADALTPLARVRKRAGFLTTTSATIADIWKERRLELAMEADRFFDLVRTGQAASVMNAIGKPFVAGKHELFPIPQQQIAFSQGRLSQNNY